MKVKNPDEIGEDILLIQQTRLGNKAAFDQLVRKYRPRIYALVSAYVKNAADTEDITQEVFIKAYQNLVCLKNLGRFPFWLRQIARNHCKNWLNRRGENPVSFEEIKVAPSANMMSSPEEMVLKQELREILWQAIDSLLEIDRKLLEARYMEDASLKELQAECGLSYPAIANRLKRAKQKVRDIVQKALMGFGALPGREVLEKLFLGGIEAVKLSLKTKLVTVGAAVVLGLGGAGVWHWHSKPAPTKTTVVHQQEMKSKKATSASTAPKVVIPKTAPKTAPQVQSANPPVRIEEKQEEISDEEWAQLEQLLAEEESSQEKKDETRDEEDAPEELTLAVRRVDELSTEIDKVDGEIEEIIRENEELKQREEYYDSIGNHVEQNNILRRIIELGNRVSQLQDPSVRAHRERAKLLAVVAKYALQEHPVAIDFLKKFEKRYGVSYKEFLLPEDKRLLLPEGGEK